MMGHRFTRSTLPLLVVLLAALALFTVACGSSSADEEVLLKYSYTTGDTWAYETTMVMNGTVEGPGLGANDETLPDDTTTKLRTEVEVRDVDEDGVATLLITQEVLEMSAEGEPLDAGMRDPQEMTMVIDSTGRVISVEEAAGTASPATGSIFAGLPFDPTQLTDQMNPVFPGDGKAKVGEEWSVTSTYPLPDLGQEIEVISTGKVLSVETMDGEEIATISNGVNMPLDLSIDLGELLQGLMGALGGEEDAEELALEMTMTGSADFEAVSTIETATGRPQTSDGTMDLSITMEITDAPEEMVPADARGPFSMELQMTITTETVE